jgi:hypothetical protein
MGKLYNILITKEQYLSLENAFDIARKSAELSVSEKDDLIILEIAMSIQMRKQDGEGMLFVDDGDHSH